MTLENRFDMERQGGLTYLREHYGLNPSELYVVNMLVRFNQGGACFPTQDKIAWETGLPIRNVKRALDSLTAKGVVSRAKQPYYDKRGRFRAGKIHHYFLAGAVAFAVQVGHPQDAAQASGKAAGQPGQSQAQQGQAAFVGEPLPDGGQNGTERAAEQAATGPEMPDRGQNGTIIHAKMAPTECHNGTNEGAAMAPHKEVIEGTIEGEKKEVAGQPPATAEAGEPVLSPKELFNRLIRDKTLVPPHRYDAILGQVRAEITPLSSVESKDEQVMAWADRILAGEFAETAAVSGQ